MVYPVTVMPTEHRGNDANGVGSHRITRRVRKQAKPYTLSLPYDYFKRVTLSVNGHGISAHNPFSNAWYAPGAVGFFALTHGFADEYDNYQFLKRETEAARNKARGWLDSELGSRASLGIALVETSKSLQMIAGRASQLYLFARALKRLDFVSAWKNLQAPPETLRRLQKTEGKLRRGSKAFANNFLEVHFGWSPLVSDIGNAVDVLQQPLPFGKISGGGSKPFDFTLTRDLSSPGAYKYIDMARHIGKVRVKCGATASLSNPNLYLANMLGFTNPALIVYDAIPFSFVVNWFYSIEEFLSGFNQFAGLKIESTWSAELTKDTCNCSHWYSYPAYNQSGFHNVSSAGVTFVRTDDLPGYSIVRKDWNIFLGKPKRALAAVSLLLQKGLK